MALGGWLLLFDQVSASYALPTAAASPATFSATGDATVSETLTTASVVTVDYTASGSCFAAVSLATATVTSALWVVSGNASSSVALTTAAGTPSTDSATGDGQAAYDSDSGAASPVGHDAVGDGNVAVSLDAGTATRSTFSAIGDGGSVSTFPTATSSEVDATAKGDANTSYTLLTSVATTPIFLAEGGVAGDVFAIYALLPATATEVADDATGSAQTITAGPSVKTATPAQWVGSTVVVASYFFTSKSVSSETATARGAAGASFALEAITAEELLVTAGILSFGSYALATALHNPGAWTTASSALASYQLRLAQVRALHLQATGPGRIQVFPVDNLLSGRSAPRASLTAPSGPEEVLQAIQAGTNPPLSAPHVRVGTRTGPTVTTKSLK